MACSIISGFTFNPTIPLNAFTMVYIAPRPAACEELQGPYSGERPAL